jgi:hypothetical protein
MEHIISNIKYTGGAARTCRATRDLPPVLRTHTWPGDLRLNSCSAIVEPLEGLTVSL